MLVVIGTVISIIADSLAIIAIITGAIKWAIKKATARRKG